ncbi:MAG: DUF456 domain-containing protein [bacterium]
MGSILPVLPGPPLSFVGLFLVALLHDFTPPLTSNLIIYMLILTIGVTFADYIIPLIGVKKYGASRWGVWGAVGGMILGIFFSPLGLILGALIGAALAEWIVSRKEKQALKAALGIFIGSLLGMFLKLSASVVMAYYLLQALF